MGDFNNYKLFKNVGIRSSDNKLIVMNVNKSNNVSFYSSDGGTNNIDVMSINSIINKSQNDDLNLSSLTGNKINPVLTINNNHGDCRIMTNLNVNGNVNINNNLIIPTHDKTSSLLSNVQGSIYFNTTENMYEGYVNNTEGWQPLGGFSKTKDATIHKNLNVIQNINCTDKITSNINLVKHNLIIPTHNNSNLLSNIKGSIYFNTTENMYEGYVGADPGQGWQPLGGFSKTKDATIHKNLNVLGNLNITGNMNQINSTQITVNDKNIILASNNNADNHIEDGGLILQGATQKSILWKSANGWKSSEKITAPHLDTVANQLLIGNTQVGLNLNFSGNNLHINGNVPKAGQVLVGNGSEVKWANTDNSLIYNQLIKVVTETCDENQTTFSKIKQNSDIITLTGNTPQEKQITLSPYIVNNNTKKVIIIFNFSVYDTNLVSEIQIELLLGTETSASGNRKLIIKNMTGNQKNDYTKYFSLDSSDFSGGKNITFKFTGLTNTGNIKIFTNDGTNFVSPVITLQEIGDKTVKAILDETRGSKSDQIAKVLVNTNANVSTPVLLNTSQATNYVYPYELHNSYTPSVSDNGTIIIIVNFALYISFNNNLTSKLKLELLLNNPNNNSIPQERTIILQEMSSNRSYEYTKYFSISKSAFGTGKKIELRFTDMNNSGNIKLFTNDGTNTKKPTVTIQEIGSTTGWGTSINDVAIGQTTSADGSFNKVVVKHNLDVSGNINCTNDTIIHKNLNVNGNVNLNNDTIIGNGTINTSLGEISRGAVPIKAIIMWSGTETEAQELVGWALCTGGTQNGITIPDLRDRFIVGAGTAYAIGNTGGAATVALSIAEMPTHSHSITVNDDSHNHTGTATGGEHTHETNASQGASDDVNGVGSAYVPYYTTATLTGGSHTHTLSINHDSHNHTASAGNTGSGSAHENRPPYYALAYIIRIQ